MKKKVKHLSLKTEKKKAWAEFSRFIRLQEAVKTGQGIRSIACYTCGKKGMWKNFQAGHGIGGRNNAILFEEKVVRVQCVGCNIFGRGKYVIFTHKLIHELGLEEFDRLISQSLKIVKYTPLDYQQIAKRYKEQTKLLV